MPATTPNTTTGADLTRPTTYRFALDPTVAQAAQFSRYAGAARWTFNQQIARAKANLAQREAEQSYGLTDDQLTPAVSWSKFSLINYINAYKLGTDPGSPVTVTDDGTVVRGLPWAHEVSADVFECASVDAAEALGNYSASRKGARVGEPVGFPNFKRRGKVIQSFRLRNRASGNTTGTVRVAGPKSLRLPRLGEVRVHGSAKKLRRAVAAGRFRILSVTISFHRGRWWAAVTGMAAVFHPARRSTAGRTVRPVGVDRGVSTLVAAADADRTVVGLWEGVKTYRKHQDALAKASRWLARTTPGSKRNARARARVNRLHAKIANIRRHVAHQVSSELTATVTVLAVENLNVKGMMSRPAPRPDPEAPGGFAPNGAAAKAGLNKSLADAAMAEVGRQLAYKADWYGVQVLTADRWVPSSKMCSKCGNMKPVLGLDQRRYVCAVCGLNEDRDVNAAANLAGWAEKALAGAIPA